MLCATFLCCFLLSVNAQLGVLNIIQSESLEKFYTALGGDYWFNNENWLVGGPCSNNWFGVSCELAGIGEQLDGVLIIDMDANNLTGTIPDDLMLGVYEMLWPNFWTITKNIRITFPASAV